jgi:hypothetical protein
VGLEKIIAVTDAGPLIHLTEIGCLGLLSIFESLHIPQAIWAETVQRGRTPSEGFLKLPNAQLYSG